MHGEYKIPGGKLVVVDLDRVDGRLAGVRVGGDFFLEPDRALDVINRALEGQPADSDEVVLAGAIRDALGPDAVLYGITPEGVAIAVHRALAGDHA